MKRFTLRVPEDVWERILKHVKIDDSNVNAWINKELLSSITRKEKRSWLDLNKDAKIK